MPGFYAQVMGVCLTAASLFVACYVVWLACQIKKLDTKDAYAQTSRDQWHIRAKQDTYVIKHEMGLVCLIFLLIFGIDLTIIGRNEFVDLASFTVDNIVMVAMMFIMALVGLAWVNPRQLKRSRTVTIYFLTVEVVSAFWAFCVTSLLLVMNPSLRNQIAGVFIFAMAAFVASFTGRSVAHGRRHGINEQ